MTIAQRFAQMGEEMGIDISDCNSGNISTVINAMTLKSGGDVSDSDVISTAMMNFTDGVVKESEQNEEPVAQQPDEPNQPSQPSEPSEPANNDPSEPAEPSQPSEPSEPSEQQPE